MKNLLHFILVFASGFCSGGGGCGFCGAASAGRPLPVSPAVAAVPPAPAFAVYDLCGDCGYGAAVPALIAASFLPAAALLPRF